MKVYINQITVNGSKNITVPITLEFSNATLIKKLKTCDSNIKAIYGPNGSGKSGLMAAIYIYSYFISLKDININNNSFITNFISETINKELKYLSIFVTFTILDNDNTIKGSYRHKLVINLNDDNTIKISEEEISKLKGKVIDNYSFLPLLTILNGEIKSIYGVMESKLELDPLYKESVNLLSLYSIVKIYRNSFNKNEKIKEKSNKMLLEALNCLLFLSNNLIIYIEDNDLHYDAINSLIVKRNLNDINNFELNSLKKFTQENIFNAMANNCDKIEKKYLAKQKEIIKDVEKFIQIYKPSLKKIEIDISFEDDKYYYIRYIFCYKKAKISLEFESTGVKKLFNLYPYFYLATNGLIVFIDELDSNLHDIYFAKLLEFFKDNLKGELCFTTHNLRTIEILKDRKYSLDFLSDDSRIYSRKRDGNNSPLKQYIHGLIPYSPFNIESFQFDILMEDYDEIVDN